MAGTWVQTHKNGKKSTTPFTFSNQDLDNIRRNTPPGKTYTFVNAVTRQKRTIGSKLRQRTRKSPR
jgi:hypothetical protein